MRLTLRHRPDSSEPPALETQDVSSGFLLEVSGSLKFSFFRRKASKRVTAAPAQPSARVRRRVVGLELVAALLEIIAAVLQLLKIG